MLEQEIVEQILKEYDEEKDKYKQFSIFLKNLFSTILEDYSVKPLDILSRVKGRKSLRKKLESPERKDVSTLNDVGDVVGIRILVYTWADVVALATQILIWFPESVEISRKPNPNYPSYNIRGKLNEERTKLPEYEKFRDLVFEIQITTVLYHSFIEQQHGVLYKDSRNLEVINPLQYGYLKEEYQDLIENHMLPAQQWLDYLNDAANKIERKEALFSPKELISLTSILDNNTLFDRLTNLKSYIEKYGDLLMTRTDISAFFKSILTQAKKNKTRPLKTQFGTFKGKSFQDIIQISISILGVLIECSRKEYYTQIVRILLKLYEDVPEGRYTIVETLKKIVTPKWIKDKIYFQDPLDFITIAETEIENKYEEYIDLIKEVFSELLSLEIDKSEFTNFDSFTIHQSYLPITEPCKEMRFQIIEYLKKAYTAVKNPDSKLKIIITLNQATDYPLREGKDKKLDKLLLENTKSILSFYERELGQTNYSLIQEVESKLLFINRRSKPEIKLVRSLLNQFLENNEYQIYRLFFGYEFERYDNTESFKDGELIRKKKIKEIEDEMNIDNLPVWIKRFKKYISSNACTRHVLSSNSHEFSSFLKNLAKEKPTLALKIYAQLSNLLDKDTYTYNIVLGLFESNPAMARKILTKAVTKKTNHRWIAYGVEDFGKLSAKFLLNFFCQLEKNNDINNLTLLIRSLLKKPHLNKSEEHILQLAIEFVSLKHNTAWTQNLFFNEHDDYAIKHLSERTINDILDNLLFAEDLDYHIETVLNQISKTYPEKLFSFLKNRINKEDAMKKILTHYSAVPYELFYLNVGPSESVKDFIFDLFDLYKKDSLKRWLSARLISLLLFKIDPEQEISILKSLIDQGTEGTEFALEILEKFDPKPSFTDEIIKYIINSKNTSKRTKSLIYMIYMQTGVVEGEYGFANYFKETAERIKNWEGNSSLKRFAEELSTYLMKKAEEEYASAKSERIQREAQFKTSY